MREYPPMIRGNASQDITALRDFLVRLVKSLDESSVQSSNVIISGDSTTQLAATLKNMIGSLATKESSDVEGLDEDITALDGRLTTAEGTVYTHSTYISAAENNVTLSASENGGVSFGRQQLTEQKICRLPSDWKLQIGTGSNDYIDLQRLQDLIGLLP